MELTLQNSWDNDELLELLAKLVAIGKIDIYRDWAHLICRKGSRPTARWWKSVHSTNLDRDLRRLWYQGRRICCRSTPLHRHYPELGYGTLPLR